jgi:mannosyl-3-phosphoglycerate phosphatase family protein
MKKQLIIFTDLDGTLLDASTYSFEAAKEALAMIDKCHIPLIICSSKTRAEIEFYRYMLKNHHPFISENGGGIFIPMENSDLKEYNGKTTIEVIDNYHVVLLGASYKELRYGIEVLRAKGFSIKGFGDMSSGEVSQVTGLSLEEAVMAKQREFDEPFLFEGKEEKLKSLFESIHELGFNFTQGMFFHLLGNSDKGKAVSILIDIYTARFKDIYTIALGDSPNDLPMLRSVDMPIVVRKQNNEYDPSIAMPNFVRTDGIGPEGWNKALIQIIKDKF